jgi:hypothetical protein
VFADPVLAQGVVRKRDSGLPFARSGNFALTYEVSSAGRRYAVRCFHKEADSLEQRYEAIGRKLRSIAGPYFVGFEFQPAGIRTESGQYPMVRMEWAEGCTLARFVSEHRDHPEILRQLRETLRALARHLHGHEIAHGDIQPGNIIVRTATDLKLIDYDGMFVPELEPWGGTELGQRNFQHPGRSWLHFDERLDRFPFAVLDVALESLALQPALWELTGSDEAGIVLRAADFADPAVSPAFSVLAELDGLAVRARQLAAICRSPFERIPALDDFLAGRRIPATAPVAFTRPGAAAKPAYLPAYAVVDATNFARCCAHIGDRVEMIGRIRRVVRNAAAGDGRSAVRVEFGEVPEDMTRLAILLDDAATTTDALGGAEAGQWLSAIGLIDPILTESNDGHPFKCVSIVITEQSQLRLLTEAEALHRLAAVSVQLAAAQDAAGTIGTDPAVPGVLSRPTPLLRPITPPAASTVPHARSAPVLPPAANTVPHAPSGPVMSTATNAVPLPRITSPAAGGAVPPASGGVRISSSAIHADRATPVSGGRSSVPAARPARRSIDWPFRWPANWASRFQPRWPSLRWPSVTWPRFKLPAVAWSRFKPPAVTWPSVRWPAVNWPSVRCPAVNWPSVRWPSLDLASLRRFTSRWSIHGSMRRLGVPAVLPQRIREVHRAWWVVAALTVLVLVQTWIIARGPKVDPVIGNDASSATATEPVAETGSAESQTAEPLLQPATTPVEHAASEPDVPRPAARPADIVTQRLPARPRLLAYEDLRTAARPIATIAGPLNVVTRAMPPRSSVVTVNGAPLDGSRAEINVLAHRSVFSDREVIVGFSDCASPTPACERKEPFWLLLRKGSPPVLKRSPGLRANETAGTVMAAASGVHVNLGLWDGVRQIATLTSLDDIYITRMREPSAALTLDDCTTVAAALESCAAGRDCGSIDAVARSVPASQMATVKRLFHETTGLDAPMFRSVCVRSCELGLTPTSDLVRQEVCGGAEAAQWSARDLANW